MCRVDTTVSITQDSTRTLADQGQCLRTGPWSRLGTLVVWIVWLTVLWVPAHGQAREPEVQQLAVQRSADGLHLAARLSLEAVPEAVEEALLKGVPLYFVWRAEVYRDRWYWTDKRVATAVRTLRLAYQPLTRRWRLSLASEPASNGASLQYAVHQSFDSLDESLRAVMRLVRWRLASAEELGEGGRLRVELGFRLDLTLLPRPFQIGLGNQPDWSIELRRTLPVGPVAGAAADKADGQEPVAEPAVDGPSR